MTPTSSTVRGVARTVSFPLLANQILVCNLSNLDEPIPRLFSFENSTPARRFAFAPPRCALAARIRLSSGPRCRGRTRRCLTSEERFRARQETGSAVPPGRPRARMTVPLARRGIARRGFSRWSGWTRVLALSHETTACSPARFARAAPRVAPRAWGESPRRQRHTSPWNGYGLGPIGPRSAWVASRCSPGDAGSRQPPAHVRFVLLRGLCLTGAAVSQGTCALFCPCEGYPSPGTGYVMDTS